MWTKLEGMGSGAAERSGVMGRTHFNDEEQSHFMAPSLIRGDPIIILNPPSEKESLFKDHPQSNKSISVPPLSVVPSSDRQLLEQ